MTVCPHCTFSNFYFTFIQVHFLFGFFYPFSIWTFMTLINLEYYSPFLREGLLPSVHNLLFPISILTFKFPFCLDFLSLFYLNCHDPYQFGILYSFSVKTFISLFCLKFYYLLVHITSFFELFFNLMVS